MLTPGGGWQGKKVTFGDDDTDAAAAAAPAATEQQQQQAAVPADERGSGSKQPPDASGVSSDTAGAESSSKKIKRVKWSSLAVQQLQQAPGGALKWKKLWPLLLQAAKQQQQQQGAAGKGDAVSDASKEKAWQKLQACSKLQITGKLVTLAA